MLCFVCRILSSLRLASLAFYADVGCHLVNQP
nr:MAG TPA: hypothetical protein [Caudoviricetes sp.]